MTTLQEAARKALEALKTCSYGDYSAKHVVDPSFDGDAVEAAIESLKAALAQQELPQKERPDFMAGYDAGMADAQPVAQPLSDDEILTIVHRKATRYTHAVAPGQVTYGFTVAHLLDFVRAILDEIPAQPVAQLLSEAVIREIADCIVSNLDSRKGVINLDLDDDLVEEIMQEMCDTIAHGIREMK